MFDDSPSTLITELKQGERFKRSTRSKRLQGSYIKCCTSLLICFKTADQLNKQVCYVLTFIGRGGSSSA